MMPLLLSLGIVAVFALAGSIAWLAWVHGQQLGAIERDMAIAERHIAAMEAHTEELQQTRALIHFIREDE